MSPLAASIGALALAACARYELVGAKASGARLSASIPAEDPEYMVLRVENPDAEPLFLDWDSAHLRGPDGFETPVTVAPERALDFVYPAARVEYELRPAHFYTGQGGSGQRRLTLARHLVPLDAISRHPRGFHVTLRLRICSGRFEACWTDEGKARQAHWATASLDAVVRRVK
ncbi:MAG: hypothetical protein IT377_15475 [Polyangiaceae bacterium]|nr:hypothetical protein [Polyangiaceae bacterium]